MPILGHQIQTLRRMRPDADILVVAGYQSEAVSRYLQGQDVELVVNDDFASTNNAYSAYLGHQALPAERDRRVILMNGDVVIGSGFCLELLAYDGNLGVTIDRSRYLTESMKVVSDGTGIHEMSKSIPVSDAFAVGCEACSFSDDSWRRFGELLQQNMASSSGRGVWSRAVNKLLACCPGDAIDVSGLMWWEIDDALDLEIANRMFRERRSPVE